MDTRKQILIVNGKDKSDSVSSFHFANGKCDIVYSNSPKAYSYNSSNVKLLKLEKAINPDSVILSVKDSVISGIDQLLDFGEYFRIIRNGKKDLSYSKYDVKIEHNCLADKRGQNVFDYFRQTANAISLVTEEGINILSRQYEKVKAVSEDTVLAHYLNPSLPSRSRTKPELLIYPFGLNQSQKTAVENAFSSQISIIQGPPGTGKTQTILNIISNAVLNGKTIAVVSNNNSATSNVAEKLEKKSVSFVSAFLGSIANKRRFLETQSGVYPNMSDWELDNDKKLQLRGNIKQLIDDLNEMLNTKNRIAAISQELLELSPEQHYFDEYFAASGYRHDGMPSVAHLTSQKLLSLWLECERLAESGGSISLLQKLIALFKYSRASLALFKCSLEAVIPYLQQQYYITKTKELISEKSTLEKKLLDYRFEEKMEILAKESMRLFHAELARRYNGHAARKLFESKDFRSKSDAFNTEYPLILSTTYSIKGTLSIEHIYDYLVIDEASQVDMATGVLAFSCARNVIIVGDQKQLPNVLTDEDKKISNEIWNRYSLDEVYQFSRHSLLSSAVAVWHDAPMVLLREHYRCHPKIAGFCNQKFYDGNLIVMTEDKGEDDVLAMYRTVEGNHARGHLNQRQIDVIREEVLPRLEQKRFHEIGIITPYRDQVAAVQKQLGQHYEVATVHKFQGREKEAIVLATVDNVISQFVDDPHMLNVAVSRAVSSLSVVISGDEQNSRTNYGDLAKYIEYYNFEIIDSSVFSVFDMLYKGYSEQRRVYLHKHKRVSEFDSENLMYSVIESVLGIDEFRKLDCVLHVPLVSLVKSYESFDLDEIQYAKNPLTHTDFLLFNRMDKMPVLVIEVDGVGFHADGTRQAERDAMKNSILIKSGIPILRLRTNESGESKRLENKLRSIL
jgi:superfamily I DNA and/or RNA helicase